MCTYRLCSGRPVFYLYWVRVRDAWSHLGEMSSESAMAAYVDEMKKIAQEVRTDLFISYISVQY